mmetsp:Transcript_18322/g.43856  ORF Transcript_18322/g.43856 Transcript_18322/m.43856 type:complete len:213 (+) Transcript_18322:175-813(+)
MFRIINRPMVCYCCWLLVQSHHVRHDHPASRSSFCSGPGVSSHKPMPSAPIQHSSRFEQLLKLFIQNGCHLKARHIRLLHCFQFRLRRAHHALCRAALANDEWLREKQLEAVWRPHVVERLRATFHQHIHPVRPHRLRCRGCELDHFALCHLGHGRDVLADVRPLEYGVGHLRDEQIESVPFDGDVELAVELGEVQAAHQLGKQLRRERLPA